MNFFALMLVTQMRRLLRTPSVLLCLLLSPLLTLAMIGLVPQREQKPILAGVLLPQDSRYTQPLLTALQENAGGELVFVQAESLEQMEQMVGMNLWECGYEFSEELDSRIEAGRYSRLITRLDSPATTLGTVLDWTVAAALMDISAPHIANQYMEKAEILPREKQASYAPLAEEFFAQEVSMQIQVQSLSGKEVEQGHTQTLTTAALIRGLVALLLVLFGCVCSVWFARDMQGGFFKRLGMYQSKGALYFPSWTAAALLGLAAGGLSLALGKAAYPAYFSGALREALLLVLYTLALASWCWVLAALFVRTGALVNLIPFLMIGCLLFSPIVMDPAAWLPFGEKVALLFPPTWYLQAAAGKQGAVLFMVAACPVLLLLGMGLQWLRGKKPA